MPTEVILPRVDMDMATGKISKWLVSDGAPVTKGQPLFEIETDKAAMEIEAESSGTIRNLTVAGAGDLAVGSVVAWIYGEDEGDVAAPPPATPPAFGAGRVAAADAVQASVIPSPPVADEADRPRSTPLARRLARERGLDLSALPGTGPRGRVQASDIPLDTAAASAAPAPRPPAEDRGVPPAEDRGVPPAAPAPQTARAAPAGGTAPSDHGLVLLREGDGTPVVLLHGFGSDVNGWRPFLDGHGGRRPVLALDLPGHGAAALDGVTDFASLVDAVEGSLQRSGLSALNLVGHSLGGAVAAAVAGRGTLDLRSLLLVAPAGLGPEINGAFVDGYLGATCEASLAPWMRELVAAPEVITSAFVRSTLKARGAVVALQRRLAAAIFPCGTQAFSIRSDLARIACPTRVVVGTQDRIIPSRQADGLPGLVALHRLANVGHMPQIEARETLQAILGQTARS